MASYVVYSGTSYLNACNSVASQTIYTPCPSLSGGCVVYTDAGYTNVITFSPLLPNLYLKDSVDTTVWKINRTGTVTEVRKCTEFSGDENIIVYPDGANFQLIDSGGTATNWYMENGELKFGTLTSTLARISTSYPNLRVSGGSITLTNKLANASGDLINSTGWVGAKLPQGPTGAQGSQGSTGAQGAQGGQGAQGTQGSIFSFSDGGAVNTVK